MESLAPGRSTSTPSAPTSDRGNSCADGRGWFRTSDLSRVKRRVFFGVPEAGIRIAKPNPPQCELTSCGTRIAWDYARLSGIQAERATFCPREEPLQ